MSPGIFVDAGPKYIFEVIPEILIELGVEVEIEFMFVDDKLFVR